MSVAWEAGLIRLTGEARIEDAETLVALLRERPAARVDLTAAGRLHTAVVQVLLAFRPPLMGPAGDAFANTWVLGALAEGEADPPAALPRPLPDSIGTGLEHTGLEQT